MKVSTSSRMSWCVSLFPSSSVVFRSISRKARLFFFPSLDSLSDSMSWYPYSSLSRITCLSIKQKDQCNQVKRPSKLIGCYLWHDRKNVHAQWRCAGSSDSGCALYHHRSNGTQIPASTRASAGVYWWGRSSWTNQISCSTFSIM